MKIHLERKKKKIIHENPGPELLKLPGQKIPELIRLRAAMHIRGQGTAEMEDNSCRSHLLLAPFSSGAGKMQSTA